MNKTFAPQTGKRTLTGRGRGKANGVGNSYSPHITGFAAARVQVTRYEGHGWDPKGPASIHRARAALDKDGAVIGYVFESKGFSRVDIDTNESDPAYSLAGQLTEMPLR